MTTDIPLPDDATWTEFRSEMPVSERWAYFDHAAAAPTLRSAAETFQEWIDDVLHNGDVNWSRWRQAVEETRGEGARLLGCDTDEIALIRNTTEGINLVAEGIGWSPGDNVVTLDCEFPSNVYPWLNLERDGVEVRRVRTEREQPDLTQLARACDARTRVLSISWVGYATGWRNDLHRVAEIAHRHDAVFFVDAIQGLGVLPLDVRDVPIDCLAADGHKWMLGPEGAGLFFIRREMLDRLRPTGLGWNSVAHAGDYSNSSLTLRPSAARYEGGTYNFGGVAALGQSLKRLNAAGLHNVWKRLAAVTDSLCAGLEHRGAEIRSSRDPQRQSGIIAFTCDGISPARFRKRARERNIVLNCRGGAVRVSPHVYTNQDDLDRLFQLVSDVHTA